MRPGAGREECMEDKDWRYRARHDWDLLWLVRCICRCAVLQVLSRQVLSLCPSPQSKHPAAKRRDGQLQSVALAGFLTAAHRCPRSLEQPVVRSNLLHANQVTCLYPRLCWTLCWTCTLSTLGHLFPQSTGPGPTTRVLVTSRESSACVLRAFARVCSLAVAGILCASAGHRRRRLAPRLRRMHRRVKAGSSGWIHSDGQGQTGHGILRRSEAQRITARLLDSASRRSRADAFSSCAAASGSTAAYSWRAQHLPADRAHGISVHTRGHGARTLQSSGDGRPAGCVRIRLGVAAEEPSEVVEHSALNAPALEPGHGCRCRVPVLCQPSTGGTRPRAPAGLPGRNGKGGTNISTIYRTVYIQNW